MKPYPLLAVLLLICPGTAFSGERSFRAALTELPPKYMGDIPLSERAGFIAELGRNSQRMDSKGNWMHWFSDGGDIHCTSMIWAKELPRPDNSPLILVHMAKPFATGAAPAADQTVVLERVGKEWKDVTKKVMPSKVDMKQHFRTRKQDTTIEVAAWKPIGSADAKRDAWDFGTRVMDLHWNGEAFVVKKPESGKLTNN